MSSVKYKESERETVLSLLMPTIKCSLLHWHQNKPTVFCPSAERHIPFLFYLRWQHHGFPFCFHTHLHTEPHATNQYNNNKKRWEGLKLEGSAINVRQEVSPYPH